MQATISNSKYNKINTNLNKKRSLRKGYDMTAKYLSRKFTNTYKLQYDNLDAFNHLIKIFLFFLNERVEKISLIKKINKDNSINLEFKVHPSYLMNFNGKDNYQRKSNIISIDKFFKENYKYIIV